MHTPTTETTVHAHPEPTDREPTDRERSKSLRPGMALEQMEADEADQVYRAGHRRGRYARQAAHRVRHRAALAVLVWHALCGRGLDAEDEPRQRPPAEGRSHHA